MQIRPHSMLRRNETGAVLVFLIAGCAYVIALAVAHLLVPRLQPAQLGEEPATA